MRRSATTLVAAAVAAGTIILAGPAAGAAATPLGPRALCGETCASFSVSSANGVLVERGLGVTYGAVLRGSIAVVDLSANGRRDVSVTGWSSRWRTADGAWHYAGTSLRFLASTTWLVRISGTGIDVSTVARGSARVDGSGRYYLNGVQHSWPSTGTTLTLRK